MFGERRKARDLVRPTSNHLHRSGQEVIELPHVLNVVPRWTSWGLLQLAEGHRWKRWKITALPGLSFATTHSRNNGTLLTLK